MPALPDELATLVADLSAWLRAWEEDGGLLLAAGEGAANVGEVKPAETAPRPAQRPEPPRAQPADRAPAPRLPDRPPPPRVAPPVRVEAPPQAPAVESPAPTGGGLFGGGLGKWAAWAAPDPAEQVRAHRSSVPDHCAGCGRPTLRLDGDVRGKLVVVAAAMGPEAADMFEKMLVRVLNLEPADALRAEPRDCPACLAALRAELGILRPRVVLAMGVGARAMVGAQEPGAWGRLGEVELMPTWHPEELLAAPEHKRAAFEHLKLVAQRL